MVTVDVVGQQVSMGGTYNVVVLSMMQSGAGGQTRVGQPDSSLVSGLQDVIEGQFRDPNCSFTLGAELGSA